MAIDPICKMDVNENTARFKGEHEGKAYYFCALGCKKAFDENPEKYIGRTQEHHITHHGCCGH